MFFESANALYIGDHYLVGKFPLIDIDGGGSLEGYFANLNWILETYGRDTIILGGHGTFYPDEIALPTYADFEQWVRNLEKTIGIIRSAHSRGDAVEQAVEIGLGPEFKAMGARPRYQSEERWINFVYSVLDA